MAKHPSRKKQKTTKSANENISVTPLGTQLTSKALLDTMKDDEERKLESILFGTPYVPSSSSSAPAGVGKSNVEDDHGEDGVQDLENGISATRTKELEALLDGDLFFVDSGAPKPPSIDEDVFADLQPLPETEDSEDEDGHAEFHQPSDDDEDDENDEDHDDSRSKDDEDGDDKTSHDVQPQVVSSSPLTALKRTKPAAWSDPSDGSLSIPLTSQATNGQQPKNKLSTRLRKLRDAPDETVLSGREYERRLRRQFELINPVPEWVDAARKGKRGRGGEDEDGMDVDDTEDVVSSVLTGSAIAGLGSRRKRTLAPGTLNITRLVDANHASSSHPSSTSQTSNTATSSVSSLTFHPTPSIPILATHTSDRRIRLHSIDGHTNPLLLTLHVPDLPPCTPVNNVSSNGGGVMFHPSGREMLVMGRGRPYFYTYDLGSGSMQRSSRGLWGNTFAKGSSYTSSAGSDEKSENVETARFSPDGSLLAVCGRKGYVHLVDWRNGGAAGQVVGSLRAGSGAPIVSLWWDQSASSAVLGSGSTDEGGVNGVGGGRLMGMTAESEVYLWDVGERKCLRRWTDEGGGWKGSGRVMGGGRGYMAIGSASGFVNIYSSPIFSSTTEKKPSPLKSIANLTTPISMIKFNHDSQIMAIASGEKKDAMRFIHIPSLTAFSNWPNSSTPLGIVTALDFSPRSEYVAIGNKRGRVMLYGVGAFMG